jgi:hypothetical protein
MDACPRGEGARLEGRDSIRDFKHLSAFVMQASPILHENFS